MHSLVRRFGALAAALALAAACSVAGGPDAAPTPAQPATDAAPAPSADYDSTDNMYLLYASWGDNFEGSLEAIDRAVANNDASMGPVMIEMLRFFSHWDLVTRTQEALTLLTGHEVEGHSRGWHDWMEWLGRNADAYAPPEGYVRWKSDLMGLLDPRFSDFLLPAENGSRVNVAEIAWGGVLPDGIPPLEQPPVVNADAQDYLLPTDRVFGVSIDGERRAYPLRIVNAHELANDVLGGEPISLVY